jgi:hypothetical protein
MYNHGVAIWFDEEILAIALSVPVHSYSPAMTCGCSHGLCDSGFKL